MWLIIFIISVADIYLTIKYEVENLQDDKIVNKIYDISDKFLILSTSIFFLGLGFGIYVLIKNKK